MNQVSDKVALPMEVDDKQNSFARVSNSRTRETVGIPALGELRKIDLALFITEDGSPAGETKSRCDHLSSPSPIRLEPKYLFP